MKFENLIICVLAGFVVVNGYTQEKTIDTTLVNELQEVVLTATRTKRQLSSLPLPVTIVSQETIKQSGTIRLNEILNEQTGIITVADESGFEGVQIQGIASDYILILIDGVPLVGRKAGNFDVNRLTVGNIKQVEVVKGPSSSLYGSEALGGVINIITEKPKSDVLSGNASYRIGSYTQQDINVDIKQRIKKLGYGVFANRFSSEGYDLTPDTAGQTVNPFENYTFNGRLYYDFSDQFSLFLSGRLYTQYQDAGFTTNTTSFEGDSEEQEWNSHIRLDHKWSDHLTTQYEFYYTNYNAKEELADSSSGDIVSDSDFDQRLLRPEIRTTYAFKDRSKLTLGVGFQYDQLDRTFFDKQVDFNSQYAYAQYDLHLIERLNIIAGARFDNHSEYSNQFSPKLALRYKITDALAAKASIGYGFKAPDFRQLYFDFTNSAVGYTVLGYNVALEKLNELQAQGQILDVVVPESSLQDPLEAESSIGYNAGLTYKEKRWNAELNFFRNDFKNLIDTRVIARKTNGQNVFSYFNFDKIYTTGLEFNTNYRITDNVRLSAGYQLLYAFDKEKEKQVKNGEVFARDPETNQTVVVSRSEYFGLVNRSRHNANFKVFYDIVSAKANINLRLLYRSKYALFDTNGNDLIDDYDTSFVDGFVTANIAASKTFYEKFTLQIGANNLFDYTEDNIPTLPGIQLYAKLNYQF
ncbi:outer membrane receptor for ferrienterochelin and colicins [Aquimarina sp. EL_43]|uniref:TonB-dependent receptor plug domain-containing protein n=1 Tax=unclassified Aquimarina TaxID=2627091 RepID=UPI0018CB6B5D|nr:MULTISPECIES: TonB-dependent receptor [unclassified Aquimarina]MBG6131803.1 outer membrane receptor for ferrienterochelin and colicins [Aquimarina sp. EL_35]MBG6149367.1 outer membrane receptor for ferrienterochelin and colicins [Aquimarina sp. EL_32]MBG6170370.1 outer membrane receptor for ferrienterochelin and colicins [Aquimarina sp. EL_43]